MRNPAPVSTATVQILTPEPNILAFYDGRVAGQRLYSVEPNWLDDGAYELGIASYAVVDGDAALVYDTHVSIDHAQLIRRTLEAAGVRKITVVLSHWHLDHVAGTAVFADCPILAHAATQDALQRHRSAIELGEYDGMPAIKPLQMPTQTYTQEMTVTIGSTVVHLRHRDIHSHDGTVLVLPAQSILLAGDTLEDTVTFVSEPADLRRHLHDLADMSTWNVTRILPNHGAPERIAHGGYDTSLITANQRYIERLIEARSEPALAALELSDFVKDEIARGWINDYEPYARVHQQNLAMVLAVAS